MLELDMSLAKRAENFSGIIAQTSCTNHLGVQIALETAMTSAMQWLRGQRDKKSTVYIVGNGGSAAVASHAQIDFLNVAKLKAQVLHEPSVITCMANDYGYENAYARLLETMLMPGDLVIAISSSGKSSNICNAASKAKEQGAVVITLSGFDRNNPLCQLGDLNFWLDSKDYGFVELGHQFILHNMSDRFGETKRVALPLEVMEVI